MNSESLTEVKNNLSRYVEHARFGRSTRILVHGTPVADIVPVRVGERRGEENEGDETLLADLERRGLIRRPRTRETKALEMLLSPPSRLGGKSLLEHVLEERESGW